MKAEDGVDLEAGDFRRERRYLHPQLFADNDDDATRYPPPNDLIPEMEWDHIMVLATDVGLKSTSYEGSLIARISNLDTDWVFSWPDPGNAEFMNEATLLAGEEFEALVFNATSGFYRQAIGCLRNALETLAVAAALSAHPNGAQFLQEWRGGTREVSFGQARSWLRDSAAGQAIDADAAPESVFGDAPTAWLKYRYAVLCQYAHSRAGYNNADFWESNGPVFRPQALATVEREFREALALSYLLMRIGWPSYKPGQGQGPLLAGSTAGWTDYLPMLHAWLQV